VTRLRGGLFWVLPVLLACGDRSVTTAADAATAATPAPSPTVVTVPIVQTVPSVRASTRPRLHLTFRSTPAGAAVTVDGRLAGATPVRWEMDDDARPHEFVFTMTGFEPWRLKFSPSQDGVIHATLVATPLPDAPP